MPTSSYERYFGGKRGSAAKARKRMKDQYGEEKGEQVFHAYKNKRKAQGKGDGITAQVRQAREREKAQRKRGRRRSR